MLPFYTRTPDEMYKPKSATKSGSLARKEPSDGTRLRFQVGSEWNIYSSPGILM